MNQINVIYDGNEIPEQYKDCLLNLTNDDNQIIVKYGNKPVINFVGAIEISYKYQEYRFFSFPKGYKVTNLKLDMKKIIASIEMTFKNNDTNNESFYVSQFNALSNIINYYHQYGLYIECEKIQQIKTSGKIKMPKTIKKITPIKNNGNFGYDKFVVTKQQTYHTLISECMAYIIETGTAKYDFYFNIINTNYQYKKSTFKNIDYLLNQLNILRINIFKDEEKKLVDNIIAYFKNSSLSSKYISQICTTNYELVYENMVHNALSSINGSNFIKKSFYINDSETGIYFTPDHLDIKNKIIADSKYYNNEIINDYKQLFYLQHIANRYAISENYTERIKEINQWANLLIVPGMVGQEHEIKQIVKRSTRDGLNLYTLVINTNDLVDNNYGLSKVLVLTLRNTMREIGVKNM